ncbi:hypothetical protein DNTS_021620, partial [Danionella cerebrum]
RSVVCAWSDDEERRRRRRRRSPSLSAARARFRTSANVYRSRITTLTAPAARHLSFVFLSFIVSLSVHRRVHSVLEELLLRELQQQKLTRWNCVSPRRFCPTLLQLWDQRLAGKCQCVLQLRFTPAAPLGTNTSKVDEIHEDDKPFHYGEYRRSTAARDLWSALWIKEISQM